MRVLRLNFENTRSLSCAATNTCKEISPGSIVAILPSIRKIEVAFGTGDAVV